MPLTIQIHKRLFGEVVFQDKIEILCCQFRFVRYVVRKRKTFYCYGDPALLLPLYYQPKTINKKFKLGIIPHVIDQQHPFVLNIRQNHPDVLIIDLGNYRKWTDVIDQICSCEQIASSSLHGLIVSDAYGIPNCWIELTGNISGGYFKFYDYASSIDRTFVQPLTVNEETSFDTIFKEVDKWQRPHIDIQSILQACPFTLH